VNLIACMASPAQFWKGASWAIPLTSAIYSVHRSAGGRGFAYDPPDSHARRLVPRSQRTLQAIPLFDGLARPRGRLVALVQSVSPIQRVTESIHRNGSVERLQVPVPV